MEYNCNVCKKSYNSNQSLWNHKNKYHNTEETKNKPIIKKEKTNNNICKHCNKELADRFSKYKHQKICPTKKSEIIELKKEITIIKTEMNKQKEEFDKLKQTTNPINPTNQTNNINQGNINQGTINNNTYNIVQIGEEKFNKILTDPQKIIILENPNPSNKLVELVYTDDSLKEYRNIRVPNLSNNKCQVYSSKDNRFRTKIKNSTIKNYGWNRRNDIEEMLDYIQKKKIKLKNTKEIKHLIENKYNNNEYIKKNDTEILNTLYDYCHNLDVIYNYLNKQIVG